MSFILAQVLALISIALIAYSSAKKVSRKTLLIFNIITNILCTAHYLLLNALSGAACTAVFTVMLIVFYFKGATKFLSSIGIPIIFGIAFTVFGLATYQSPISIIPIVGHILLVIAFWMDREIVIKEFCIVVALLWVIYNGLLHSYVNFIGQSVCFVTYTTYVIRYHRAKKKAKEAEITEVNENVAES